MTLISLLLVLSIERIATQSTYWQSDIYLKRYQQLIEGQRWLPQSASIWGLLAVVGVPSVLLYLLLQKLDNALLLLILSTALLMICIGCPALRATYKCYLQAASRGDAEACFLYADQLGHQAQREDSFGQSLVWLNYQHYAAVTIWFTAFGAAGAVFYTLSRGMQQYLQAQSHPLATKAETLMSVLDWIPVRITALGFLLVGHFSRALPIWLSYLPDPSISARQLLAEVSRAAEEIEPDERDSTQEPMALVKLAKRNIMFILVIMSLLTLAGWID